MAPRTRAATSVAQTSLTSQAVNVNTHGLPALADEVYLEIISFLPSVPIPTPINLPSYPGIRRSRHEALLGLSQACRSLRRFFWRYVWQRIEVREGMKVGKNEFLSASNSGRRFSYNNPHKKYPAELVRQLEIVTVRNPDLAQHVNYLDILMVEYSFDNVIAELARCMSLFPNLHTVQIDIAFESMRDLRKTFERTFEKYSYPQIRNVFINVLSRSLLSSCPEAKYIGYTTPGVISRRDDLLNIARSCPRLEALGNNIASSDTFFLELVVNNFPVLRHISISPLGEPCIDVLANLRHLQSITLVWWKYGMDVWNPPSKEAWIEAVKRILLAIQRRDNLKKFITMLDPDDTSETITLHPTRIENLDGHNNIRQGTQYVL